MVEIVLTAEQVRNAPPEVKEWLCALIDHDCAFDRRAVWPESEAFGPSLAICSGQNCAVLFDQIRSDYIACHIFFELGGDDGLSPQGKDCHRLGLRALMRRVRLQDPQHLFAGLDRINQAFRRISGNSGARLFRLDDAGGCWIREETHRSVKTLFESLTGLRPNGFPTASPEAPPAPIEPNGAAIPISAGPYGLAGDGAVGNS